MSLVEEIEGARLLADRCVNVRPGEHVLIVGDWRSGEVPERLAAAIDTLGAEASVSLMAPRKYDGNEPPATVAASMQEADAIILVPSRAIAHSAAANRALESGARIVAIGKLSLETLRADGLRVDFEALSPKVKAVADRFTEATTARLTAENGTDMTFSLEGREGNGLDCTVSEPGDFTVAYCAEANVTPVPEGTNGRIVFDGSIPNLGVGLLQDDIVVEIENGSVTSIEGGQEARKVRQIWSEYDTPAVREAAELAVGLNPNCTELNGGFINDHGVYGSVHVGFGTSSNLGGETRTPLHFDITLQSATLELDGETVLEDREFTLPAFLNG
ncbi:aminopeptidase [Halobellus sp. GM3]|uniref:aminopeptidase n=1 Tax=Halobellus sp. GM3 TaxID=3458410 RepID=UPI00403DE47D